jgi:hypothetical protein
MENIEYVLPGEIEKRSFAIIGEELKERGIVLPPEQEPVTKRVIHTSADFDYAKTMTYSPHAVQIAKELIAGGADIVTDTNMALAGINKKRLGEFVRTARFDRMGAFAYSEEEGTYSAKHYKDEIPQEVKQQRLDKLMELQQEISADLSHRKIGQEFKVIIDRKEGDYYIGRTQFDSPEVDPEVLIKVENHRLRIGSFHRVKVYDADDFDLYATIVK